jgi:hypothetical protein
VGPKGLAQRSYITRLQFHRYQARNLCTLCSHLIQKISEYLLCASARVVPSTAAVPTAPYSWLGSFLVVNLATLDSPGTSVIPVIGPIPDHCTFPSTSYDVHCTLSTSYTYVYIPVSHVYKLACTLHRTINLLPLVCCTPTSDISHYHHKPSWTA